MQNTQILKELVNYIQLKYPNASIGLIGCHSVKLNYPICEYDFLIINECEAFQFRVLFQEYVLDIINMPKGIRLSKIDPWLLMALKDVQILIDHDWSLHSLKLNATEFINEIRLKFVKNNLYYALLKLARSINSFSQNDIMSANFWLKSMAYDCIKALITHFIDSPRPSHLFEQFRTIPNFTQLNTREIINDVIGLSFATESSLMRMIKAFDMLIELNVLNYQKFSPYNLPLHIEYPLIKKRVRYLIDTANIIQAYYYLNYEVIRGLESLYDGICQSMKVYPNYDKIIFELMSYSKFKIDMNMLGFIVDQQKINEQIKIMKKLIKEFEDKLSDG